MPAHHDLPCHRSLRHSLGLLFVFGLGALGSGAAAAQTQAAPPLPRVVSAKPEKVCQIVGEVDRQTGRPTPNATESRYGFWGTDLGASFEHQGKLHFLFGDTHASGGLSRPRDADLLAVSTDDDPDDCLEMAFLTDPDGGYRPLSIPGVSSGEFSVPTGGLSVGGEVFVFATTDFSPANPMGRSVLASSRDGGRNFALRRTVSTEKFINVAPAVAEAAAVPGLPVPAGKAALLWASGRYRQSAPYFAVAPADRIAQGGAMRYFAGLDPADGSPRWSGDEADAAPLFEESCLGELSVAWNPHLRRWLMLYNCGTPNNRIYMRSAERPWGPWSAPETLFAPGRDDGPCPFLHPGQGAADAGPAAGCARVSDPHNPHVAGDVYGPYMIPRFARGVDGASSTIYYLMSTWNPYTVVLMRSTLTLDGGVKVAAGG
ncbi:MAG TPA: DUF4185 domain-containing protein [Alphaproteobacteria bacterium]|nr:DUF4185 domain-containing protein [Alphaproteobacteria bacterium]